jgi:hypothetical protein
MVKKRARILEIPLHCSHGMAEIILNVNIDHI